MKQRNLLKVAQMAFAIVGVSLIPSFAMEIPEPLSSKNIDLLFQKAESKNRQLSSDDKAVLLNECQEYVHLMVGIALASEIESVAECEKGWIAELRSKKFDFNKVAVSSKVKSAEKEREKIVAMVGEEALADFEKTIAPSPKTDAQILILAARKNRNPVWTDQIPDPKSLSSLVSLYQLKLYNFSATNKFAPSEKCNWFVKMQEYAANDKEFGKEFASVAEMRERLVKFSNSDAVSAIDLNCKPPSFPVE